MMLERILALALALAWIPLASGAAPDAAAQAGGDLGSGPLLHGKLALSLADAISMGLENNLDVQVQRYAPLIAGFDEKIAWGSFDPQLFAELAYVSTKSPTSSGFEDESVIVSRETAGFGGFRGMFPLLGTEYAAEFDGGRYLTDSTWESLSPKLRSSWSLRLTQPLLKDLIWNDPWTQVKTTRVLHEASLEEFRRAVMDTVRDIESAYWTLIAQEERYRVARKSVETARALLDQTRTQHEVGVVSKVEVTEAEAGLARREFDRIVAENQYRNQLDVLIDLVLGPHLRAASTLEIEPTDRPDDYVQYEVDLESAVALAFDNRPELAAARDEVERQTIQLKFASNQRLPELDSVLSFGRMGLAGSQRNGYDPCNTFNPPPGCPGPVDVSQGDFGNTFDDYKDAPAFTAGMRFGIPIPNTAARKRHSRTQMELRRAESQLRRQEQRVILEVREAARNLEASQEGIESASRALTSAEEQLRAERIRLEYGESTPFDVLQREEQLVQAETGLIDAYRAYRVSASQLDRFQGTILRNRNIKIDQVSALR
ncbi:MAG: TolC family protein [Myxococcales bacterium]|nr:TolC family protein [Myxococcales bacterium]MDH5307875.1 TolC family protein [Myxococcales bacterium]MDH5566005.1 TolC family protein [Myxococcales bacterium]